MRRSILIPTDFSRNAWDAIAYAADFFVNEPCDFYILNVYNVNTLSNDNLMTAPMDQSIFETFKENSEKGLERILTQLAFRDEAEHHQFYTLSQQNNLLDAIKEVVAMKDIDLIVMGTKGDTDALNATFGSNTVTVMEKVRDCPVLAIPPQTLYTKVSEIVFPTSFQTHYKKQELKTLIDFAQIAQADIRILHVTESETLSEEQQNFKELLEQNFENIDFTCHFVSNKDINEAVDLFVQSRDSGMIAFINKKHTFFSTLFRKPMVQELGMHAKVPVLALHDHRS